MARLLLAAALAAAASEARPIRVSCVGDSITVGVCSRKTGGYPKLLQGLLGTGYNVTNYGNSGKTMLKSGLCGPPADGDCAYWDTPTWPEAQASQPDIVTIMLGTNDAKIFNYFNDSINGPDQKVYAQNYAEMVAFFKSLVPQPKVYLIIPPPLYYPFPYQMVPSVINVTFPALIPKLAQQTGADGFIDVFHPLVATGVDNSCDGCHPTDPGYTIIATTIYTFLTQHVLNAPPFTTSFQ